MTAGGCLLAMSYYGAEKAIAHYNVMGTVKAALEAAVRYMALELGQAGIRVNALSPGPVKTRAASGIDHFDELLERAVREASEHRRVTLDDVGATPHSLSATPPRRLLETLPMSMPAITSWREGEENSFTVTIGFFTGLIEPRNESIALDAPASTRLGRHLRAWRCLRGTARGFIHSPFFSILQP